MPPKEFFETYKDMAIEQQKLYGIPASVTLAQMALESGWGTGRAIKEGNNAFCVKAGGSSYWNQEGHFILISDEKKDEKFRKYDSLQQSFDDHSKVLMGKHYAHCRKYASTDYQKWCYGLQSGESTGGKYAGDSGYSTKLISIIEKNGLSKYDRQAVEEARSMGKECGYARADGVKLRSSDPDVSSSLYASGGYCMPLDRDKIEVTSLFGHRSAPTPGASTEHNGVDIRAKFEELRSMEQGTVVSVGQQKGGGYFVMMEYARSDGHNYRVSYCHLDKDGILVEPGQRVYAGQPVARSGDSGVGTGPHLHLTVRQKNDDGKFTKLDPLKYLAEISVRGNLSTQVVKADTNKALIAGLKADADTSPTPADNLLAQQEKEGQDFNLNDRQLDNAKKAANLAALAKSDNPLEWLSYMMTQNGEDGQMMSGGLSGLISSIFMGAIMLAMNLQYGDRQTPAQQLAEQKPEEKASEQEHATLVHRDREGVDLEKIRQTASSEFEMLESSQEQSRGVRLA